MRNLGEDDGDTFVAAKLLVVFAIGTCLGALLFGSFFYAWVSGTLGLFVLAMAVPIGGSALVLRWTGSMAQAAPIYLLPVWLMISGTAVVLGGPTSPAFPAYAILILGATFMSGRRAGILWTVLVIASIVTIQSVPERWLPMIEVERGLMQFFAGMALAVVLTMVCLFALIYDSSKSAALNELRKANQRIAQMVVQLEHASERLVNSQERFLGSRGDGRSGLIGRMLQKARDGQVAIEQSRVSVAGMIGQYRQIAARVQHLFRYSQLIVDVVSTIDRISDRLDLMALNVGIEAAHSGEAGKQFTILAGDMRALAERVLAETQQIKSALQNVHEQIREVLESSTSGQALTEESAAKIAAMARTFDEIYGLVEETESATGQITEDTLTQISAVRRLVSVAARSDA
ncbi:methyl-accepting chemotaxis protein [Haliangium sp.]|uniref:methyl-accepting chemotaxis protein n=1 Tax=Haliangium sp. TaxID=2663208 RepID=UPI003D12A9BD